MPAGVINTLEDSEDDKAYTGRQKEIQREVQEFRAVESWMQRRAPCPPKTGRAIDLRLDCGEVKRKQSPESGASGLPADVCSVTDVALASGGH